MPYLELAEFGSPALIRTFDFRYDLIYALVKRWRPETYTFHLLCGECIVTLEDVALQLGLPIDRSAIMGVSMIAEPVALCYSLLGVSPNDDESKFTGLIFSWLKANFEHLSINATEQDVMCTARAYIMYIIGGVLLPDANNNRTIKPDAVDTGGCLILLQSWAFYRMASVRHKAYVFPLVNKWSTNPSIGRSYTVPIYNNMSEKRCRIRDQKLRLLYPRLPTFILTRGALTNQLPLSR
ncbi:protein MAIN-LIKE 2-like [Gossypium raimondii]|uniref:protein MAIN-LIKE 2-like n=1 Tax=Gossypium raimondii TaxID=29730 RepID=UPI00063ADFF6|nr:protein MAIN-LIKE 2-like [Gossypium raimondii]